MLKITKIVLALLTVVLAGVFAKALFYRQHSACNKL